MSLKWLFIFVFLMSCSKLDHRTNNIAVDVRQSDAKDMEMDRVILPKITPSCISDFSSCDGGVTLVVGEDKPAYIPFQAFSKFEDGTSLVFNLEGEAEALIGDIKLADGSKERALPPMAGIVEPRENEDIKEIIWHSVGDTIQVSFPRPDFMKIVYDVGLTDVHNLSRPYRHIKGEFTAPIRVRCYTGVPGSGEGVRDSDFSSEFCKKYQKHNHKFPPATPNR